jgi:hypothetical protein
MAGCRGGGGGVTNTVYRCWDENNVLLYVGLSNQISMRLAAHARTSPWYSLTTVVTSESFPTRILAEVAERKAIRTEQPKFNIQGIGGEFDKPLSGDCDVCTLENTVTPHAVHCDFNIDVLDVIRAHETGEIHGHTYPFGHKLLITSVSAWALRGFKAAA